MNAWTLRKYVAPTHELETCQGNDTSCLSASEGEVKGIVLLNVVLA